MSLLMRDGRIAYLGPSDGAPDAVLDYYNALIAKQRADYEIRQGENISGQITTRSGNARAVISRIELFEAGKPVRAVRSGESVVIRVVIQARTALPDLTAGILIRDRLGNDARDDHADEYDLFEHRE